MIGSGSGVEAVGGAHPRAPAGTRVASLGRRPPGSIPTDGAGPRTGVWAGRPGAREATIQPPRAGTAILRGFWPRGLRGDTGRGVSLAVGALLLAAAVPASANHVVMHGGPFGGVVVQLVLDPAVPGTLYLAAFGRGVYRSTDGGRRWVLAARGLEDPAVLALALDPREPGGLFAGTDSGVFVSRDRAGTWTRLGLRGRNVRSLAFGPGRPAVLYAATDQGVLASADGGGSWQPRNAGLEMRDVRVLRRAGPPPGWLYAAGFGGVFRSGDGGRTWQAAGAGLGDDRVRALAVDPVRPERVYAGTAGGGVFVTTDGGRAWWALNAGLRNHTVLSLLLTPEGERYVGTVGGVQRWDPAAGTWRSVGEDLLTLTVTVVAADPHRPGRVYAGTGGLVFVSDDRGEHWRELAVAVSGPGPPGPVGPGPRTAGHSPTEGGEPR